MEIFFVLVITIVLYMIGKLLSFALYVMYSGSYQKNGFCNYDFNIRIVDIESNDRQFEAAVYVDKFGEKVRQGV